MPLVVADRVRETTITTGTGAVTLAGAVTGYQSFSAVGNGNTTYYTINAGSQWEVGIGTYSGAGPSLSRDTVLESSNSGSLVNFSAGTKDVFVTYPAEKSISDGYGLLPIANGGTGATTAAGARTALGATTVGGNVFTLTNPSAITFPRFNADNTVSALDAATFRTAIGAGTSSTTGTVTSVSGTGTVNGLTLTGTVTTSGSLTLGGTLSGISLTTQVTGTLPVANGGTGTATAFTAGSVVFAGASGVYSQDNANLFWDNTNDRLGIGNTDPGYRLDVTAGDTTSGLGYGMRLRGNASANGGSMQFTDSAVTAQWAIITANTSEFRLTADGRPMTFYTGGAERARITSSGFLLVGTTAPLGGNTSNEFKNTTAGSWPLTLNSNDRGLLVRNSAAGSGFYAYFEYNGGTNNGSISWSGGTTAYNTTSDYRLKEINGPITNSGAYIDALKPVEGWWKADGKRFIGLVAHEVQKVSETAVVVGEKDGEMMQQMDYSAPELIANLIAEVQALRARVAQLEGN